MIATKAIYVILLYVFPKSRETTNIFKKSGQVLAKFWRNPYFQLTILISLQNLYFWKGIIIGKYSEVGEFERALRVRSDGRIWTIIVWHSYPCRPDREADGEYLLVLMTLTSTVPLQSCPAGIDQLCCKPQVVHNRLAGAGLWSWRKRRRKTLGLD